MTKIEGVEPPTVTTGEEHPERGATIRVSFQWGDSSMSLANNSLDGPYTANEALAHLAHLCEEAMRVAAILVESSER